MTLAKLDLKKHSNIKIRQGRSAAYGENIHFVPVIADELKNLVLSYPVCFIKSEQTGQFDLYAVMGFTAGENLFLVQDTWRVAYVPMHLRRQPFLLSANYEGTGSKVSTILLDENNARVNQTQGEALFNSAGEMTPYLAQINTLLADLARGVSSTRQFVSELLEHDLIEPINVSIQLDKHNSQQFEGLYSINETALSQLNDNAVVEFHQKGYLQACHYISASIGNLQTLLEWKKTQASVGA